MDGPPQQARKPGLPKIVARLVLPLGFVVSLLFAGAVMMVTDSEFEATRGVVIIAPATLNEGTDRPWPINPLLNFTGQQYTATNLVAISVGDLDTMVELAPPGSGIEYQVIPTWSHEPPILNVNVTAPSADQSDEVADRVVEQIKAHLRAQQKTAKAPEHTWFTAELITTSDAPKRDFGNQLKWAVAGGGVVAFGTLMLAALVVRLTSRHPEPSPR